MGDDGILPDGKPVGSMGTNDGVLATFDIWIEVTYYPRRLIVSYIAGSREQLQTPDLAY